jgi:hypothetical protein
MNRQSQIQICGTGTYVMNSSSYDSHYIIINGVIWTAESDLAKNISHFP